MEALGQLSPQDWLQHSDTRTVMQALQARGATARFAGGCVRDAILGLPVHDVDIAIDCAPEETMALLQAAGIRAIPTGLAHGTVTAVLPDHTFEITTLRKDIETDGRHAVVDFTDDWDADAARRDLTINALYADLDGTVYDPCHGLADLGAGRVRFVGNAEHRIGEDVLRLLRFFRFYGRFGKPPANPDALSACRKLAHRIPELSGERIRSEMLRILAGHDPGEVLVLMRGEGVTPWLFSHDINPGRLRVLAWLESRGIVAENVHADPLRRLAALILQDSPEATAAALTDVSQRWRLSNSETERLKKALVLPPSVMPLSVTSTLPEARKALYCLGEQAYRDHVLLAWATYRYAYGAMGPKPGAQGTMCWDCLLRVPQTAPPPEFPLSGRDVVAMGLSPGPQVGTLLRQVETEWIADDFQKDRQHLLARLSELSA